MNVSVSFYIYKFTFCIHSFIASSSSLSACFGSSASKTLVTRSKSRTRHVLRISQENPSFSGDIARTHSRRSPEIKQKQTN